MEDHSRCSQASDLEMTGSCESKCINSQNWRADTMVLRHLPLTLASGFQSGSEGWLPWNLFIEGHQWSTLSQGELAGCLKHPWMGANLLIAGGQERKLAVGQHAKSTEVWIKYFWVSIECDLIIDLFIYLYFCCFLFIYFCLFCLELVSYAIA